MSSVGSVAKPRAAKRQQNSRRGYRARPWRPALWPKAAQRTFFAMHQGLDDVEIPPRYQFARSA